MSKPHHASSVARGSKEGENEVRKSGRVPKDVPVEVVRAMCGGDHEAYRTIYINYEKSFRNFLMILTRSEDTAKEISQEAFVTLWEKRSQIDPEKSVLKYLYKIGKNAVLQQYRHQAVHQKYSRFTEAVSSDFYEIENEMVARETELLIKIAVSRMPEQRRKVFEMGRFEGLSNDEIAARLNISSSSVRSHLQLALRDIKEVIAISMLLFFN
ncbi:MAG: RNA polymerase sigma-70 factor [Alistipes sp.]|nr:RNA polymerase sigma-70 factor [Alistipes sp.]